MNNSLQWKALNCFSLRQIYNCFRNNADRCCGIDLPQWRDDLQEEVSLLEDWCQNHLLLNVRKTKELWTSSGNRDFHPLHICGSLWRSPDSVATSSDASETFSSSQGPQELLHLHHREHLVCEHQHLDGKLHKSSLNIKTIELTVVLKHLIYLIS